MPEFLEEFLSWYLAPWRRIDRKTFGIALTIATIPGIIIMIAGFGGSGGSFLDPLMSVSGMGGGTDQQAISSMSNSDLQLQVEKMRSQFTPDGAAAAKDAAAKAPVKAAAWKIDWSGILNGLCLVAMIPLSRMRMRDMGWFGWQETFLTVVFNISVVEGLIQSISGYDVLPYGTLWGFLNFGGYAWLSIAKAQYREAVHEKVPTDWQPPHNQTGPHDDRY